VHTHRKITTIEGWGSLSHVQNVMEKIREDNQNIRKTSQIVNQTPTPKLEHDKIEAQWALNIPLKSMLERV
jgi:hypothetical protein